MRQIQLNLSLWRYCEEENAGDKNNEWYLFEAQNFSSNFNQTAFSKIGIIKSMKTEVDSLI